MLEGHPLLLEDEEVEDIIERNIEQVKEQDEEDFANLLAFAWICCGTPKRSVSRRRSNCWRRRCGRCRTAAEAFVERAVKGLRGGVPEKMELLNWLAEQAKAGFSGGAPIDRPGRSMRCSLQTR